MTTINISLPDQLKTQAETLISQGFYASFSDLVRDSLRRTISLTKYDRWALQAKQDLQQNQAVVLKSKRDVDTYLGQL